MGEHYPSHSNGRQATEEISKFAIDRHGRPAGFTSVAEYERQSVAALSATAARSNPRAATSKPAAISTARSDSRVRRMSFYRPDASYRPAIEHLAELRVDERRLQSPFPLRVVGEVGSTPQIHAFTDVISSDGRNARPARRPDRAVHRSTPPAVAEESEDRSCLHTARPHTSPRHESAARPGHGRTTMLPIRDIRTQRLHRLPST